MLYAQLDLKQIVSVSSSLIVLKLICFSNIEANALDLLPMNSERSGRILQTTTRVTISMYASMNVLWRLRQFYVFHLLPPRRYIWHRISMCRWRAFQLNQGVSVRAILFVTGPDMITSRLFGYGSERRPHIRMREPRPRSSSRINGSENLRGYESSLPRSTG